MRFDKRGLINLYYKLKHNVLLLFVLLMSIVVLSLSSQYFFTWDNIRNILNQSTLNIILSVGMTYVICSGGIDLSVGAIASLAGIIMALAMKGNIPVPLVIALGLILGTMLGSLNGLLVGKLKINPFIVTLSTTSIFRGINLIITSAIPVFSFPNSFTWLGSGRPLGVPMPVILTLIIVLLGYFLLNFTKFGYYAVALGGNEEALKRVGVSVNLYKGSVYALSGFLAAMVGLIITARLNSADPMAGYMYELDAIATVILGGTNIRGGYGSIGGTVLAGMFLAVLHNGLTINGIDSYYQLLLVGVIILASVIISERRARK